MGPDLITLGVICDEKFTKRPFMERKSSTASSTDSENEEASSSTTMTNSSDARKKSLISMYSTGFVFNQNQKHLVKALPWSGSNTGATVNHNPVMTSEERQKMVSRWIEGRGHGRKAVSDQQVQSLQSEKMRTEHASSMFALLI